jgi:sirohydrochlorin ferrochelatase
MQVSKWSKQMEQGVKEGANKTALLIIDHGSKQQAANQSLDQIVELVDALLDREDVVVYAAHMELAPPSVAQAFAASVAAGATRVIAVPYLLAGGRHASRDIPSLVSKAAEPYPEVSVRVSEPLGPHRLLAQLVIERAQLDK